MPHVIEHTHTHQIELAVDVDGQIVIERRRRGDGHSPEWLFTLTPDDARLLASSLDEVADDDQ